MKRYIVALTLAIALLATGCAGTVDETPSEPQTFAQTVPEETPVESPEPLVAETPTEAVDEESFIAFVRARLATFPSQIPDATDAQLLSAAAEACERIRAGDPIDRMSVIEDEKLSAVDGYYYDSNAIIAGAQMNICKDTLDDAE